MKILKRLFPVVCITGIVLLSSLLLYGELMEREEERCWKSLSNTAEIIDKEITMELEDEIIKLQLLRDIMLRDDISDKSELKLLHIETILPNSIFSRIDVLYPDNTLITNGEEHIVEKELSYEKIKEKGEYLSGRKTDYQTEKECVYYVLPVIKEDRLTAVLIGMIDTDTLLETFQPIIYDGQTNVCIIDREDGSFIIDNWHDELGNFYEYDMSKRKMKKGYEGIDMIEATKRGEPFTVAFQSYTTGKDLYLYSIPSSMFDWQLSMFVPDDVLFADLWSLRDDLLFAGVLEAVLLGLYFLWNIGTVRLLEKNVADLKEKKEQLKYISYRDLLTSLYNRNKYSEVCQSMAGQELIKTGIVYLDLNGLKEINDTQSHEAGDRYICEAASVISEVFGENAYRIGGDEFVILAFETEQEEFMDKAAALEEYMKIHGVSVSTGVLWKELCINLTECVKEAEREMYADKEKHYLAHDRWR